LESPGNPEVKLLKFPHLQSPGKGIGAGKPRNSKVVVLEILLPAPPLSG